VERVYSRDAHVGFGREAGGCGSAKDARRVGAFASCPEKKNKMRTRALRRRASKDGGRARTFTAHAGDFVERRPFRLGSADAHGRGERSRGHVSSVVRASWLACGRWWYARNGRETGAGRPAR
jgi:hypothetical protein